LSLATLAVGVVLMACGGGDGRSSEIVEASLVRQESLPGDDWRPVGEGLPDLFSLLDIAGLPEDGLLDHPACGALTETIEESLIEFAHVPAEESGSTAYVRGALPLSQALIVSMVVVYGDDERALQAATELSGLLDDRLVAPCLAVLADQITLLRGATGTVTTPIVDLNDVGQLGFSFDGLVLIFPVQLRGELHVIQHGRAVGVLAVIDFNTRFLRRDGSGVMRAFDDRLRAQASGI
jgi:hypothetical protein